MPTIRYLIHSEKRKLANVFIRVTFGRGQIYFCKTGLYVEPQRWSNDTQTIRQRILTKSDQNLITRLRELKEYVDEQIRIPSGQRSSTWLLNLVNKFHGTKNGGDNLNSYIIEFLDKAEKGEIKNKKGINFAEGTIKSIRGLKRIFFEYQGIYSDDRLEELRKAGRIPRKRTIIDYDDVTVDFYNDFVAYMSNEGYAVNTIGKHIGTLKDFMRRSLREKKHSNREFLETAFSGMSEESHAIYLTLDEIETIWRCKVKDPRIELARDCFIVLCETAVRISDYRSISVGVREVDGNRLIDIYQKKTNSRVVIPLTRRMEEVLTKYNGQLPYIHERFVNEYIKTVAFQCKMTEVISWPTQKKGVRFPRTEFKWKMISCHTGRRSAATNMVKAGIDPLKVMKITGHKTWKSFMGYIRIGEEETAIELSKHPYFNRGLKVV